MPSGIDRLLDQLASGGGLFSPITPFHSQKRLARAVAPAIVSAAGGMESAGVRGGYGLKQALATANKGLQQTAIAGQYGMKRQEQMETGATERAHIVGGWRRHAADQLLAGKTAESEAANKMLGPLIQALNVQLKGLGVAKPGPHMETTPTAMDAAATERDKEIISEPTYTVLDAEGKTPLETLPTDKEASQIESALQRSRERSAFEDEFMMTPEYYSLTQFGKKKRKFPREDLEDYLGGR